jgi:hypothetical protein
MLGHLLDVQDRVVADGSLREGLGEISERSAFVD